jgi:hypothetical protein
MGKGSRQVRERRAAASTEPTKRDRMARVQVDDATWADFRALAGYRPISEVLGEMVTREVERSRSRRLRDGQLDDRQLIDALKRAREQQADLAAIVERVEALTGARRTGS